MNLPLSIIELINSFNISYNDIINNNIIIFDESDIYFIFIEDGNRRIVHVNSDTDDSFICKQYDNILNNDNLIILSTINSHHFFAKNHNIYYINDKD